MSETEQIKTENNLEQKFDISNLDGRILSLLDALYNISDDKEFCEKFIPELSKNTLEEKEELEKDLKNRVETLKVAYQDFANIKNKFNLKLIIKLDEIKDQLDGNNVDSKIDSIENKK